MKTQTLAELLVTALILDEVLNEVDLTPELRIRCAANEMTRGTGMHKHHCTDCGVTWKHHDILPMVATEAQFEEAHACPGCGKRETLRYEYTPNFVLVPSHMVH